MPLLRGGAVKLRAFGGPADEEVLVETDDGTAPAWVHYPYRRGTRPTQVAHYELVALERPGYFGPRELGYRWAGWAA
jgi:hypothetical protein